MTQGVCRAGGIPRGNRANRALPALKVMVVAASHPQRKSFIVHLRRFPVLTAAALAAALVLTGCGDSKEAKGSALDKVTVTGGSATTAPTVTVDPKPLSVTETAQRAAMAALSCGWGARWACWAGVYSYLMRSVFVHP